MLSGLILMTKTTLRNWARRLIGLTCKWRVAQFKGDRFWGVSRYRPPRENAPVAF
jgi:hypothetical protein